MALEAFDAAFKRLEASVSRDDARQFQSTTLNDVWEAAKGIERHLEARGKLRRFRRMELFLNGLEQYSKVIEVLCNGTPYLPYIWAPVKLVLQISRTHVSALEKLIEAYSLIGESLPRFNRLSATFVDNGEFQQVVTRFYVDILEFHRRAYKYFRRRAWSITFDSLWKQFDIRFQLILESLRKCRDQAKNWRGQQLAEIEQWRVTRTEEIERRERERCMSNIREAVAWLGVTTDQEDTQTRLLQKAGGQSDSWIIQHPSVVSWLDTASTASLIWLHGKPGGGKSVLCSQLVDHLQAKSDAVTLFYYCQQLSQVVPYDIGGMNDILRNFVGQLFKVNTELAPWILETFASRGQLATRKTMETVFERMVDDTLHLRIIVDGLDECSRDDQEDIRCNLAKIKVPADGSCKILISSRNLESMASLSHKSSVIRLEDNADNVNSTIKSFIELRILDLSDRFAPKTLQHLKTQIMTKANGMILWVRLVLITLENLYFEGDGEDYIDSIPTDLEILYQKLFESICGNGQSPKQRRAIQMLQWMLVARRPLRKSELECAIALDKNHTRLSEVTRPRGDALGLCYPILEIEGNDGTFVNFIHFTAYEYLRDSTPRTVLQQQEAHLTVSVSCVLYLTQGLGLLDPRIPEEKKSVQVSRAYHELNGYATEHWINHVEAVAEKQARSHLTSHDFTFLCRILDSFILKHNELLRFLLDGLPFQSSSCHDISSTWNSLDVTEPTKILLEKCLILQITVVSYQNFLETRSEPLGLNDGNLVPAIRSKYNDLRENLLDILENSHPFSEESVELPHRLYFCRYKKCPRAFQGFQSAEFRKLHESSHFPSYRCVDVKCALFGYSFKSKATIEKHVTEYHTEQDAPKVWNSLSRRRGRRLEEKALFRLKEVLTDTKRCIRKEHISVNEDWLKTSLKRAELDSMPSSLLQVEAAGWCVLYNPALHSRLLDIKPVGIARGSGICYSVDVSPCDRMIAVGCEGRAIVFEAQSGIVISALRMDSSGGRTKSVRAVCFSPCSTYLATGDDTTRVRVWYISPEAPFGILKQEFTGHKKIIKDIAYASNGDFIVSGSADQTLRKWSLRTLEEDIEISQPYEISSVAISPDCQRIATGGISHAWIFDASSGAILKKSEGTGDSIDGVAFSRDGQHLYYSSLNGTVYIWKYNELNQTLITVKGLPDMPFCVTPFWGNTLFSTSDTDVHFIDAESGRILFRLGAHPGEVMNVAASYSSGLFATCSGDGRVQVWRIEAKAFEAEEKGVRAQKPYLVNL